MDEQELDVYPFERDGKWHWRVIGPFPKPAGAGKERDNCCDRTSRLKKVCQGFPDKGSAERDGSLRRKEILLEMQKLPI